MDSENIAKSNRKREILGGKGASQLASLSLSPPAKCHTKLVDLNQCSSEK